MSAQETTVGVRVDVEVGAGLQVRTRCTLPAIIGSILGTGGVIIVAFTLGVDTLRPTMAAARVRAGSSPPGRRHLLDNGAVDEV